MNIAVLMLILAVALYEGASVSQSAQQSLRTRSQKTPSNQVVDEQVAEIGSDRGQPKPLPSFGSPSRTNNSVRKLGRTTSKPRRVRRSPSGARKTNTNVPVSTDSPKSDTNVLELNVGEFLVIDQNGTVTKDDGAVVYRQHSKLKGDPKDIVVRQGTCTVNGVELFKRSSRCPGISGVTIRGGITTSMSPGAKWIRIQLATCSSLEITDDRNYRTTTGIF